MTLLRFAVDGPAKRVADRLRRTESAAGDGPAKRAGQWRRRAGASDEREAESGGVGDTLRAARRGMGVSLEDAAAHTNLRETYLTALENDKVEALGLDPAYVRGTLRSYADYLGLDVSSLLARYRANGAHGPGMAGAGPDDQHGWHQLTRVVGGVVGLVIIAVVAFTGGGMLAHRPVLPVADEREGQHEPIRDQGLAPSALRLEFVEETWVRVTTDDRTVASPPYAGDARARAATPSRSVRGPVVSELVGGDAGEQPFVARVGAAESTGNGEWYVPVRQDRRRSLNVVCDAAFRCRIDQ